MGLLIVTPVTVSLVNWLGETTDTSLSKIPKVGCSKPVIAPEKLTPPAAGRLSAWSTSTGSINPVFTCPRVWLPVLTVIQSPELRAKELPLPKVQPTSVAL